jgi:predicted nuclease of predicted toxin-antitoxin system
VGFLRTLGHDVVRVNEVFPATAGDKTIVSWAAKERRAVLTQDLDLSAIVALTGKNAPSLISLRLSSTRIEYVNALLQKILPDLENDVQVGTMVSVEDSRVRRRQLPIT